MRLVIGVLASLLLSGAVSLRAILLYGADNQTAPLAPFSISGVVVDGVSHTAIAAAVVEVSPSNMEGRDKQSIPRRQFTDSKGRFAFIDVPAGAPLTIRATKAGYLDGTYASDPGGAVSVVGVPSGTWLPDVRIDLFRPASLGGLVSDELGVPVVDVWVRLLAKYRVFSRDHLVARALTRTDDRGQFRFGDLAPGDYVVQVPTVQASGQPGHSGDETSQLVVRHFPIPPPPANGQVFTYPAAFYPGGSAPDLRAPVTVTFGEQRDGLNVTLVPAAARRVSGTLVGPPGAWTGLPLRLVPQTAEASGAGDLIATALVSSDGHFLFVNVPEGNYRLEALRSVGNLKLRADAAAFREMEFAKSSGASDLSVVQWELGSALPGLQFAMTAIDSAPHAYWARQPVTVAGSDIDVVVPLHPAIQVDGRIMKELVASRPTPNVEPAAGLFLDPADGSTAQGAPRTQQRGNDPSPTFSIQGVIPGKYFIRARNGWTIKSISRNGLDYTDRPMQIDGEQTFGEVEVVVTNGGVVLDGVALDEKGQPRQRTVIFLFPANTDLRTDSGLWPSRIQSAVADKNGRFQMTGLPAGDYLAIAVDDPNAMGGTDPEFFERVRPLATPVSLTWGADGNIALRVRGDVR